MTYPGNNSQVITTQHLKQQKVPPRRQAHNQHIGLINDYVRIPYANGSSFASQFLYREFVQRGHQVTVIGPSDPSARTEELPEDHVCMPSLPLRNHPGVRLAFPTPKSLAEIASKKFDVILGQTASELADLGVWLRYSHHIPYICVNTIHLPKVYNVLIPDRLVENPYIDGVFRNVIVPWTERHSADVYNQCDGLIVLSKGLERYWRNLGVRVPIHVVPRCIEPKIFDYPSLKDPFDPLAKAGSRLLVICRHTREKSLSRLLRLFARHIVKRVPDATLTLVGDGPDYETFRNEARQLGIDDRTFFPGEFSLNQIPDFFYHADLFVYTSLSETYGQVISEAMWCGLPVVAFEDGIGVSQQIQNGKTGILVPPGPDEEWSNKVFADHVVGLLNNSHRRKMLAENASQEVRVRAHPDKCIERYYDIFEDARENCIATIKSRISKPFVSYNALARWSIVQTLLAGLGCIRPPAIVNRHGRRQPEWDKLPSNSTRYFDPFGGEISGLVKRRLDEDVKRVWKAPPNIPN